MLNHIALTGIINSNSTYLNQRTREHYIPCYIQGPNLGAFSSSHWSSPSLPANMGMVIYTALPALPYISKTIVTNLKILKIENHSKSGSRAPVTAWKYSSLFFGNYPMIGNSKLKETEGNYSLCQTMAISGLAPSRSHMNIVLLRWLWRFSVFFSGLVTSRWTSFHFSFWIIIFISGSSKFHPFTIWFVLFQMNKSCQTRVWKTSINTKLSKLTS